MSKCNLNLSDPEERAKVLLSMHEVRHILVFLHILAGVLISWTVYALFNDYPLMDVLAPYASVVISLVITGYIFR